MLENATPSDSDDIALPDLPRELKRLLGQSCSYHKAYLACVDARIPAERRGARYFVRRSDLPVIASALGLSTVSAA